MDVYIDGRLGGELQSVGTLDGCLSMPSSVPVPPYEGKYVITPLTVQQDFATQGKRMTDNLTVLEIPYAETSNEYGLTVTIAS